MINIGVTGWGDHESLYQNRVPSRDKLQEYAAHFPTVEVDASFYAIQSKNTVLKWVNDTPEAFRFIVKAYQGMTGHQRGEQQHATKEEMFQAFIASLEPYVQYNKLAMVLFQFPPWFDCTKEHVSYLRYCREKMGNFPVALEFRNQTWFYPQYLENTLRFMEGERWIHSICDEPQAGIGSVPTILQATSKEKTLVRMHGRNVAAWMKPGGDNWREVRYLYRYNEKELLEWKNNLLKLQQETRDIYVVFNNNSGGDAADNAKQLIQLLNIDYQGLAAKQLDLF
ncbi:DUF72 domain-containing protein [Bacillus sp. FJAT-50079]|uniref:DUF72 domain-containing protein n=1 Tax=Bacillus sp. FJAT-50079 TaxID=2833577 RepID=UPI001BC9CF61|nr:DUF72 domain-containing protein [Bacillus sp. FJAT-50079]MBS4208516.1 DUF72 domain-containing protein [Bacillus sp. FJAT-50079]